MADGAEVKHAWVLRVLGVEVASQSDPDPADDDPDKAVPPDDEGYRRYLLKVLKRVQMSGTANFGIALGAKPTEHRMMLGRRKPPQALARAVVQQTGKHVHAFGHAEPDPDRPVILRLSLEGPQPPGLKRKGEKMLRAYAPLPFTRIALWAGDGEVQDLPPASGEDDDADADPLDEADLRALLPQMPSFLSRQAETLQSAAQDGVAFCEECPADEEELNAA